MKYKHILWDWNGTLLDDVECAVDCVNAILNSYSLPETNLDEYYKMMEPSLEKYYSKLINLDEHSYLEILTAFQDEYKKRVDTVSVMNGAKDVLEFLDRNGAKQYIVSSFEKTRLTEHVKKFGMDKYFQVISGANDIKVGSKSDRAAEIIKNVNPENAVYIGDTFADYETAKDIGCRCILISSGHQSKADLMTLGVCVLDNISQIMTLDEFK